MSPYTTSALSTSALVFSKSFDAHGRNSESKIVAKLIVILAHLLKKKKKKDTDNAERESS